MHSPRAPEPQSPGEEDQLRQALNISGAAILGAQGPLLCEPSQ
ncbi:rCG27632 [Rattus norvegicus]|uniref:RCG27632 n=1 Tax=Rattus norvegicus TaxID=10116 RepID=A6KBJ3_RAT|nr:rCG27632 [Rattus norvegicus]